MVYNVSSESIILSICLLLVGTPLWLLLIIWKLYARFCRKKKPDTVEPMDAKEKENLFKSAETDII